ncbi:hypothetical protein DTO280E4_3535 [Paecilomyces variotii]|nr:hypothetical protein DTO169E5_615 [Paecilomyces variotii]KAJ9362285.1 hypothetical protein DTO280E4_3535 [Paecilomyces variotii]
MSCHENTRRGRVNTLSLFGFTTRKHIPTLIVAVLTTIAAAMIQPLSAIFLGNIFDTLTKFGAGHFSGEELLSRTSESCGILLSLGVANWILSGLCLMFWLTFGELQAKSGHDALFLELLKKDMAWFEGQTDGVGALLVHIQGKIRDLQRATSEPLGFAMQFSIRALVALGVASFTSWRLTLVTLAAVPPCAALVSWLSSRIQQGIDMQKHELATSSRISYNAFSLIRVVKCFNGQGFEYDKYVASINRAAQYYLWQAHLSASQISCVRFMSFGMFVQGFWYGSSLVASGSLSSGQVLRTFWACLVLVQSIEQILPQTVIIEKGKAAGSSLRAIMDQSSCSKQLVERHYPRRCKGSIEIKNISFAYPSHLERLALQSSSFLFPAGEMTFIIGPIGSGKSTLASLLARIYAPMSGKITIDGYPMEALDSDWIRDNITIFHQQNTLFDETILTNIVFGCPEHKRITEGDIQESIDVAMLRRTIGNFPEKLDTFVTSQGNTLSGGQKQRIAIARARLRDTPILILDECTGALDYTTRRHVMDSIRQWREGKTTIVITHDLSQIRPSDLIYVLKQGRVEEKATDTLDTLNKDYDIPEKDRKFPPEDKVPKCKRRLPRSTCQRRHNPAEIPCQEKEHHLLSIAEVMIRIPTHLNARQRLIFVLALFSTVIHAVATPVFSYLLSRLLQTFYANGRRSESTMKWSLAILAVVWIDSIRKVAMSRILDQPLSWFEQTENEPSTLVTHLTQDAEDMRNLISKVLGFILLTIAIISIAGVWSVFTCWELSVVIFACAPFIYAVTDGFEKISKEWETRCDVIRDSSSLIFADTFSRIQTVKALTLESYFRVKHMKASTKAVKAGFKRAGYSGLLFGLVDSMVLLISALIFYYGAVLASSQKYTTHDILTVFSVLLFSTGYVTMVLSWIPQLNSSQLSANRLLRMASLGEKDSHEHSGILYISNPSPISLANINFGYPSRPGILAVRDLNLSIPANSCTTIVGHSGSGKSTLVSLLMRLYALPQLNDSIPWISMRGVDIGQLDIKRLRSLIAVVPQQPALFPDTIAANIAYGLDSLSPFHTEENIRSAAKAVGIDDFILSLPEGYSTVVGDGGLSFSGGQTQLLTIARALVRQPRVLVLDEVTASLDAASAGVVRRTVRKLVAQRRGLTVIIVSHSREMMDIADNVVVMEQGTIVEEGPYHALMQREKGKLRRLIDDADARGN